MEYIQYNRKMFELFWACLGPSLQNRVKDFLKSQFKETGKLKPTVNVYIQKLSEIKPPFNVEKLKGHRNSNLTSKWFWSSSDLVSRTRGAAKKKCKCACALHHHKTLPALGKMLLIYNNGSIYCSRTYFIFCCKITAFFLQVFFTAISSYFLLFFTSRCTT